MKLKRSMENIHAIFPKAFDSFRNQRKIPCLDFFRGKIMSWIHMWTSFSKPNTILEKPFPHISFIFELMNRIHLDSWFSKIWCDLRCDNNTCLRKCPNTIKFDIFVMHVLKNSAYSWILRWMSIIKRCRQICFDKPVNKRNIPLVTCIEYSNMLDSKRTNALYHINFKVPTHSYEKKSFTFENISITFRRQCRIPEIFIKMREQSGG